MGNYYTPLSNQQLSKNNNKLVANFTCPGVCENLTKLNKMNTVNYTISQKQFIFIGAFIAEVQLVFTKSVRYVHACDLSVPQDIAFCLTELFNKKGNIGGKQ